MVVWLYQLNGHEFEQALGVGKGQGSLVCPPGDLPEPGVEPAYPAL